MQMNCRCVDTLGANDTVEVYRAQNMGSRVEEVANLHVHFSFSELGLSRSFLPSSVSPVYGHYYVMVRC